jgi:hypothetical protein
MIEFESDKRPTPTTIINIEPLSKTFELWPLSDALPTNTESRSGRIEKLIAIAPI